jgi:toxin YoeB
MRIVFSQHAWEDYLHWQRTDKRVLRRINELVRDIQRNRYEGIGKPESLRHNMSGYWSRRIDSEHRLVYKIEGEDLLIAQLRYHY